MGGGFSQQYSSLPPQQKECYNILEVLKDFSEAKKYVYQHFNNGNVTRFKHYLTLHEYDHKVDLQYSGTNHVSNSRRLYVLTVMKKNMKSSFINNFYI